MAFKDPNPTIVFNDFSGGDLGLERPARNDTTRFRALNTWIYDNGIGPRQPVLAFPVSSNYMKAVQLFDLVPGEQVIVVYKDKQVRRIDTGASITPDGTGSPTNLPTDSVSVGGVQFYVSPDGFGATYNVLGNDFSDNVIPAGRRIDLFGVRLVIAPVTGVSPDAQSIAWSGAGPDATLWPGTNTVQVAPSAGIEDFYRQGNTLLLTDNNGNIYVLSGTLTETPDTTANLRTVEQTGPIRRSTVFYPQAGVAQLGAAWWRSGSKLIRFDGNHAESRPGFERPSSTPALANDIASQFMSLSSEGECLFIMPGADSGASTTIPMTLLHSNGAFTQHVVPVSSYTPEREPRVLSTYSRAFKKLWIATGGSDSQAPIFYNWLYEASFPSTASDGDSGAPVTATFRTADYWAPIGTQMRVRTVTVDYSYKPADVGSNQVKFDIAVEALSQDDDFRTVTSTPQTFTPSSTATDNPDYAAIQRGRKTFSMGEQGDGAAFRVLISNWRGCIIHSITVETSIEESP